MQAEYNLRTLRQALRKPKRAGAAEDALKSAAYTYVVAALSSLATLIYYVMIYMGRRD